MSFEHYQGSMDAELKTGFVQMMARSGGALESIMVQVTWLPGVSRSQRLLPRHEDTFPQMTA